MEILQILELLIGCLDFVRFWRFMLVVIIGAGCIALVYHWISNEVARKGLMILLGHAILVVGVIREVNAPQRKSKKGRP